jgi:hypothetical protein
VAGFWAELDALVARYKGRVAEVRAIPGVSAVRLLPNGLLRASVRPKGRGPVVYVRGRTVEEVKAEVEKVRHG